MFDSTQLSLLWICAIAAILVFASIMYSTATFRHRDVAPSGRIRRAARELGWASIPILIVVLAAAPAVRIAVPDSPARGLVTENHVECSILSARSAVANGLAANAAFPCSKTR